MQHLPIRRPPRGHPSWWSSWKARLLVALGCLAPISCSGGSGSGSSDYDGAGTLLSVRFPDPLGIAGEPDTEPPQDAPLVQQIVFEFSGRPDPDQVSRSSVQLRDENGAPAEGRFDVRDRTIVFTPTLPLSEARDLGGGQWDTGGAGLRPDHQYTLRVGRQTWDFVSDVEPTLRSRFPDGTDPHGIALTFRTTRKLSRFFRGLEPRRPRLLSADPADGSLSVTPQLYTDPAGLFAPRAPFLVRFDAPVHPAAVNLGFLVVDLDDPGTPGGLPLGVDVRVLENELDHSLVEITPSGVLPFGHLLSLEQPEPLFGLSGLPGDLADEHTVLATFTTAPAPDTVDDHLVERFDDNTRQETDASLLSASELPAEWDRLDSGVLQASFAFDGAGELGRFVPSAPPSGETKNIVLDTNVQVFPLFDGSTPDAPPGYTVHGGVFHFTEIVIPKGVFLEIRGSHPLVFTATDDVKLNGTIDLNGKHGTAENAFDSGVASIPGGKGGAGGGRGGESHPILFWPPDQFDQAKLVSPAEGGTGWGPGDRERIGGGGGECGVYDHPNKNKKYGTNQEINCLEVGNGNNNGDKAAGGSGGSFLRRGTKGRLGIGNVRPDTQGGWLVTTKESDRQNWDVLHPGQPGVSPFKDPDSLNDFIGVHGELKEIIGGQGGGGGGSRSEGYYCGAWCLYDEKTRNDGLCRLEWGFPPLFGDGVSDARGGSAGGAGGAFLLQSLGSITLEKNCSIRSIGGTGRGGETTGSSNWGGPAGGGSGGAIVLQSAASLRVLQGATLNVTGGNLGGSGIIQLQVPDGQTAEVESTGSIKPLDSWVDADNTLNPARFTALSVAISTWYDLGRTIARPPAGTNPLYTFRGLDLSGFVPTDAEGKVIDPDQVDIRCDYLGQLDPLRPGHYLEGQEPRANFIPPNASIQVHFQGADAVAEGSKEVAPPSITKWSADPAVADAHQFIRYRITFDIAADTSRLRADAPRPAVQSIQIRSRF